MNCGPADAGGHRCWGPGDPRPPGICITNHLANPILRPLLRCPAGRRLGRRLALIRFAVNVPVSSLHRLPSWVLGHCGSGRTALRRAVMADDAAKQEPDAMR